MIFRIRNGTTDNYWDKRIPFEPLWAEYKRITKANAAIVLFANNIFTIELAASAKDLFKYKWVWVKSRPTLFIQCKVRPMVKHEDILIFSKGNAANRAKNNMTYNPQGIQEIKTIYKPNRKRFGGVYGKRPCHEKFNGLQKYTGYPSDVLCFNALNSAKRYHSTQKPVDLLEYLIRTYTNEGELVLDNCIGSGSTAVACVKTGRNFIGFETDAGYCEVARQRVTEAQQKIKSDQQILF